VFLTLVGAALAAGGWFLARTRAPGVARRAPAPSGPGAVRASVVVPARDEAAALPRLLASLGALDDPPHEVIVVDDASTDGTAGLAAAAGARVVDAGPLPAGWAGKPWACHVGAAHATGTHLVFLDADTWLAPDALGRLLYAHREHGGLLSVQPYAETGRAHEELSAYANTVAMMGSGAFSPRPPAVVRAAFGACLVTTAADYARAGGHAGVRGEVVEDVRLAHRYRAAGLPVTALAGGHAVRFRMYPDGPGQLVEGWTKNLAAGAAATSPVAALATAAWVTAHVAITARLVTGVVAWARGRAGLPLAALAAWFAAAVQFHGMLRRIGSFRAVTAAAFPLPLAAFVGVFARSCARTFVCREVTWRGRRIPLGRRPVD
jgi:4,4'-diaponeurosporenoate glycosyltransferase